MPQNTTISNCNRCGPARHHEVVHAVTELDERRRGKSKKIVKYAKLAEMLKCRGCGTVSLRLRFGILREDEFVDLIPQEIFPRPLIRHMPPWIGPSLDEIFRPGSVPEIICDLMRQIYAALQNNARVLAVMGIRTVIERIMIDKVGDAGTFITKLDEFCRAGYLSERQRGVLDGIVDAGHAATHRAWNPSFDDIQDLLDVVEFVVKDVYLHEPRIKQLEKKVPRRLPRRQKPQDPTHS